MSDALAAAAATTDDAQLRGVWGTRIEVGLVMETADERRTAGAVIVDGIATLVLEDGEAFTAPASAVPLQLARLVGLSPRPSVGTASAIVEALDELDGFDRASLIAAFPAEALQGMSLGEPDVVVWMAWVQWPLDDGVIAGRSVIVADGGAAGLTLIDVDDLGAVARTVTSTDVWMLLCGLLPYPAELEAGAGAT